MLPPKPFMAQCEECGWRKVYAPKSDVIDGEMCPSHCPSCGVGKITRHYSNELGTRVITWLNRLLGD